MTEIHTRQIDANGLSFTIDEAGHGDAVALCLHGFPESRRSWREQLPALAALGWRAVAPDLRGYGGSSRPAERAAYALDHLTADVSALFDALGARRRLLIAHDWGAIVAWVFAIERGRPLDGLVIMNAPHPAVYLDHVRRSPSQWLKSWYVLFFQLPWLPETLLSADRARIVGRSFSQTAADAASFPEEIIDHYRDNAAAPGAMTAMINYYRANATGLGRWGPGRVPRIETPTLMVWGERDPFLGVALTQGYRPYVADMTLVRLAGVSHWVQQEAADRVNAILRAWLGERGLLGR
ncbi:MAG TPA: alpha/beta hydrolase [Caulobacteraceae bacterium]|nr:alpha/beta hydrolase [Caulobacteraceae bacterium]